MKRLILVLLACASAAHAQMDDGSKNKHNVNVMAGMSKGGFDIGATYEYMLDPSTGFGGQLRSFQKHDTGPNLAPGVTILGAVAGMHFYKKAWDLAITPSFNIISIDSYTTKPGDATTLGPGLSIGMTWAVNSHVGLGFDYSNFYAWFAEDWRGNVVNSLDFRVKASF